MTPEQTRNYWILEGYPLMPEWIEFCRAYDARGENSDTDASVETAVKAWDEAVIGYYGEAEGLKGRYTSSGWPNLNFVVAGVTYKWNLGV